MDEECSVRSIEDIDFDLACSRQADTAITTFFTAKAVVTRAFPLSSDGGGRALLAAAQPDTRKRFETLLHFEQTMPPAGDYGVLVGPACQILETEVDRLLTVPARQVAPRLIANLQKRDRKQGAILEAWVAQGYHPTTMGTETLVLLALRRGCEQGDPAILEFLATCFRPRYKDLLLSRKLGACLDTIRNDYRNQVSHTTRTVDLAAYERFVRLVVANGRFGLWSVLGPDPTTLEASVGVLHHHLSESRLVPSPVASSLASSDKEDPVSRLLALRSPDRSPLMVHLRPYPADGVRGVRSIAVTPAPHVPVFRVGMAVRFGFEANQTCHGLLLNVGTSGAVTVLWPNAWCRATLVVGDRPHFVPGNDSADFQFAIQGPPGVEHVVAVVALRPLAVALLPEGADGFRKLTAAAIHELLDALGRLSPSEWAANGCSFQVGP